MSWQLRVCLWFARTTRSIEDNLPVDNPEAWLEAQHAALRVRWPALFPRDVKTERVTLDGVPCEWFVPTGADSKRVLLFVHGGGSVFGWDAAYRHMLARLARRVPIRALAVDYRLAPEFSFPAPLDDCLSVYRRLLADGHEVVVVADSSGGYLALALLVRLRDLGLAQPLMASLISPLLDQTYSGKTVATVDDPILMVSVLQALTRLYVGTADPRDPLISPLFADLHGLPLLHVEVGEAELLRSDSTRLAERAEQAGVPVSLTVWPEVFHGWYLFAPYLAEATQVLEKIAASIQRLTRQ